MKKFKNTQDKIQNAVRLVQHNELELDRSRRRMLRKLRGAVCIRDPGMYKNSPSRIHKGHHRLRLTEFEVIKERLQISNFMGFISKRHHDFSTLPDQGFAANFESLDGL